MNRYEEQETVTVELDLDGTSCLKSKRAKLYFETYKNIFRFYKYVGVNRSMLRYLYLAMPSVPLCVDQIEWKDHLPLDISLDPVFKESLLLLQSVHPQLASNDVTLRYTGKASLSSENRTVFLNRQIQRTTSEVHLHPNTFIDTAVITHGRDRIKIVRRKDGQKPS
jgi:hypothetical protein